MERPLAHGRCARGTVVAQARWVRGLDGRGRVCEAAVARVADDEAG